LHRAAIGVASSIFLPAGRYFSASLDAALVLTYRVYAPGSPQYAPVVLFLRLL